MWERGNGECWWVNVNMRINVIPGPGYWLRAQFEKWIRKTVYSTKLAHVLHLRLAFFLLCLLRARWFESQVGRRCFSYKILIMLLPPTTLVNFLPWILLQLNFLVFLFRFSAYFQQIAFNLRFIFGLSPSELLQREKQRCFCTTRAYLSRVLSLSKKLFLLI